MSRLSQRLRDIIACFPTRATRQNGVIFSEVVKTTIASDPLMHSDCWVRQQRPEDSRHHLL
jgi:hypothetical protein